MDPDANDATAQVLHLRAANPDAVIMILFPKPAAVFIATLRNSASSRWPSANRRSAIPRRSRNRWACRVRQAISSRSRWSRSRPTIRPSAGWRAEVTKLYPSDRLSVFNLFGVGSAEVMVEGLRRAGHDLTREKFIDAMNHLTNFQTDVYGGPITCTPTDHRCNKNPVWMKKDLGGPIHVVAVTPVD